MIVNKKLDRFKQWAGERMGGEVKTNTSDDFKALEDEMTVRSTGMDKLHRSMTTYVKWLSKRTDAEDKEKYTPVGFLGSTMISHGEDFDPDSEYGSCLSTMGRTQERLARVQETYIANATASWLEGLERSLTQMKEYNSARKKLEQRRLAYDTSLAKMQKAKKEDFRVEEELRTQKVKYEESSEDVYRRMEDIKEAEKESVEDLTTFMEAELAYHEKCREMLLQVKRDWPARVSSPTDSRRPAPRSRSNTAHSYAERFNPVEEEPPMPEPKLTIPKLNSRGVSPARSANGTDSPRRPSASRQSTFESPSRLRADDSPSGQPRLSRVPTEPSSILANRAALRPVRSRGNEVFDDQDDYDRDDSPHRGYSRDRSVSPAPSYGTSAPSRAASWSNVDTSNTGGGARKPPPPPPSRAKKPPPPPPPMKRSTLSSSEVPHY